MKKIGILAAMAFMVAVGFSSCQERREKVDDEIAYKIENKEALTSDDYTRMIQYVGEYAQKMQPYLDLQINDTESVEAKEGIAKLNEEYPLVDAFRKCIAQTPLNDFTPDNLNLLQQYAGYLEFTVPDGFTIQTNPEAAGLEVEAPEGQPGSEGVVVGAVDTAVVDRSTDW